MAPRSHSHRHCAVRIPAALVILGGAVAVSAFSARSSSSSSSSSSSDGGITIVGLPGGGIESLPGMYVRSIRRWIEEEEEEGGGIKMEPIPGAGGEGSAILGGWVDPTTTSELWWPRDLAALQVRPTLNVLLRSGVLSYVSAGLDVRVPRHCRSDVRRDDGDDDDGVATSSSSSSSSPSPSSWRNHGLNSQPIARQWTTLNIAMERMFHVEGFVVPLRGGNGKGGDDGDDGERRKHQHETLFPSLDARDAMERVATFIAEMDTSSPLAEGFHIASFPMTWDWIDLPNDEEERGSDDDDYDGTESSGLYKIVCLATSEPFASKLMGLDDDILAMSSTSVLEINVSRTAKGGESMYLPEVYKNLYLNGSTNK